MIEAKVICPVWATKRLDQFPAGALVRVSDINTGGQLVAVDRIGVGPGEVVLVARGAGVSKYFKGGAPVDAMIVGVLDGNG